mgnify:CR=1 FL=1
MLVDNQSKVTVENTKIEENWTAYPQTLGDVSIISILGLIVKKIKNSSLKLDENIYSPNKHIKLIDKLLTMLDSDSDTKKDVSLLILYYMTLIKPLFLLMLKKEFINTIIIHINKMREISIIYLTRICELKKSYNIQPTTDEENIPQRYSSKK